MVKTEIAELIECAISSDRHIVSEPICLSCAHSICSSCLSNFDSHDKIECLKCKETNKINLGKCNQSLAVKMLIDLHLNDLFKMLQDKLKVSLEDLKNRKTKFEDNITSQLDKIHEEIDERVAYLKSELDNAAKELHNQVNNEAESYKLFNEKYLDDYKIYEDKLQQLNDDILNQNLSLAALYDYQTQLQSIDKRNSTLVKPEIKYEKSSPEIEFSKLVGCVKFTSLAKPLLSSISDFEHVNTICDLDKCQDWKMIYKASIDGFDEERFHKLCDNLPETLTLLETTYGYKFGGYREQAWRKGSYSANDEKSVAFLYDSCEKAFVKGTHAPSQKNAANDDDAVSITDSYHLIPSKPMNFSKNAASELKLIRINQHMNNLSPNDKRKKITNTHNIFTLNEIEVYVKAKPRYS